MAEIVEVVARYIAMWNETDPERRRELVAATVTEDATYLDPQLSGEGAGGIDEMIASAQQQFPGHRFELSSGPDAHHDVVRFGWTLYGPDGDVPVIAGLDFATVADDGRLKAITGFLEPAA
jgi:hypothetical protein